MVSSWALASECLHNISLAHAEHVFPCHFCVHKEGLLLISSYC